MQFDDTDPHRRNLIVTSLAFIVFEVGGGRVPDCTEQVDSCSSSLKLSFLNVELTNLGWLYAVAITVLIWFAYRYRQKCPRALTILNQRLRQHLSDYFHKRPIAISHTPTHRYLVPEPKSDTTFLNIESTLKSFKVQQYERGSSDHDYIVGFSYTATDYSGLDERLAYFKSIRNRLVVGWRVRTAVMKETEDFADWFVPWVLFWAAFAIAVLNGLDMLISAIR